MTQRLVSYRLLQEVIPLIRSIADLIKEIFLLTKFLALLSLDSYDCSTATTKTEGRVNNEESRLLRVVWLVQ